MITLISKWKLRNGCPEELLTALQQLAENAKSESGALMYLVNLQAPTPIDSQGKPLFPPPPPIPLDRQEQVVFVESYENVEALSQHIQSQTFIGFLVSNFKYFQEDPHNPGFPQTETEFLDRRFAFIRPESNF
jgi:quinol monooxygenase YgiN